MDTFRLDMIMMSTPQDKDRLVSTHHKLLPWIQSTRQSPIATCDRVEEESATGGAGREAFEWKMNLARIPFGYHLEGAEQVEDEEEHQHSSAPVLGTPLRLSLVSSRTKLQLTNYFQFPLKY